MSSFQHGDIRRGRKVVVHAGEISLPPDSVIGLVGVNGAGKSTLMMHLADVLRDSPRAAPDAVVGYAPQRPTLPTWLRSHEIADLFGLDYSALESAYPSLRLGELRERRTTEMSVGQTQTLSIAFALATDAPLVLLDEPFGPLDFHRRVAFAAILRQPPSVPRCTVVSSQSAAELLDVCTSIVVLAGGRYVFSGPIGALTGGSVSGEGARSQLEQRIMSLLEEDAGDVNGVSGSRIPIASHPQ